MPDNAEYVACPAHRLRAMSAEIHQMAADLRAQAGEALVARGAPLFLVAGVAVGLEASAEHVRSLAMMLTNGVEGLRPAHIDGSGVADA